jgi:hypothetical protein
MPGPRRLGAGAALLLALVLLALVLLVLVPVVARSAPDFQESASPQEPARAPEPASPAYQLLANPGVEFYDPPYARFEGVDCQKASGWDRFWYGAPEPYWMDTRVLAGSHLGSGWVERIQGETSQLIIATEPYTAGIQQTVSGLTPGLGYGFHAAMLTIFQTSAPPVTHGTMIKQVGIDPTGGADPRAATVVWSEPDDHDEGPWDVNQRVAVYAQSSTLTVFVRVRSLYPSGGLPFLNYSFLDSAILARTPVAVAESPAVSQDTTFAVRWDNAEPAPDGGQLKWTDVQWLDEAEGVWHDWFNQTSEKEATFEGQRNHTYRFRARAWQRYPNGAHLYGPYRPEGDTITTVSGPKLAGSVLSNEGQSVGGAVVSVSGSAATATTGPDGVYEMAFPVSTTGRTVSVSHPWLAPPEPVYGVTVGPTETVSHTWVLRPPDDAVANGGFEAGLAAWSSIAAGGGAPAAVMAPVHTGRGALALKPVRSSGSQGATTAPSESGFSAGVTQGVVLANSWQPVLSFWYRADPPQDGASGSESVFSVLLTVVNEALSPTLPITSTLVYTPDISLGGWQHQYYPASSPGATVSGTVTVRLRLQGPAGPESTTLFLDEVSLGRTPGGPHALHLPMVLRSVPLR